MTALAPVAHPAGWRSRRRAARRGELAAAADSPELDRWSPRARAGPPASRRCTLYLPTEDGRFRGRGRVPGRACGGRGPARPPADPSDAFTREIVETRAPVLIQRHADRPARRSERAAGVEDPRRSSACRCCTASACSGCCSSTPRARPFAFTHDARRGRGGDRAARRRPAGRARRGDRGARGARHARPPEPAPARRLAGRPPLRAGRARRRRHRRHRRGAGAS